MATTTGVALSVMKQCVESSQICSVCASLQKLAWEYLGSHFEKQYGRHRSFFDGHPGVLYILRLFLIYEKLNVFMVDIFNEYIHPL